MKKLWTLCFLKLSKLKITMCLIFFSFLIILAELWPFQFFIFQSIYTTKCNVQEGSSTLCEATIFGSGCDCHYCHCCFKAITKSHSTVQALHNKHISKIHAYPLSCGFEHICSKKYTPAVAYQYIAIILYTPFEAYTFIYNGLHKFHYYLNFILSCSNKQQLCNKLMKCKRYSLAYFNFIVQLKQ